MTTVAHLFADTAKIVLRSSWFLCCSYVISRVRPFPRVAVFCARIWRGVRLRTPFVLVLVCSSPETWETISPIGIDVTVIAKRRRCAEVFFQFHCRRQKASVARKYFHCCRQMLPWRAYRCHLRVGNFSCTFVSCAPTLSVLRHYGVFDETHCSAEFCCGGFLFESTEVSAVPAEVVDAKTSVEESLIAPVAQCKSYSYMFRCDFGVPYDLRRVVNCIRPSRS